MNKKGFKHGIVTINKQIKYTDFKSLKKSLDFYGFFSFFSDFFWGGVREFSRVNNFSHLSLCTSKAGGKTSWPLEVSGALFSMSTSKSGTVSSRLRALPSGMHTRCIQK